MRNIYLIIPIFIASLWEGMHAQNAWWQQNSLTSANLNHVNFANDAMTGWVFGDSVIGPLFKRCLVRKTTNQGQTWTAQYLGSDSIQILSAYVFSPTTVLAVGKFQTTGNGAMARTSNGGTSWYRDTTSFTERLFDVDFADANTGWVTGRNGYIARTNNTGNTWSAQVTPTGEDLFALDFVSISYGWAVGADPGGGGVILRTIDGGVTWTQQSNANAGDLFDIQAINVTTAIAVGQGGRIILTTDSGNTWSNITSGTIDDLYTVSFPDPLYGWAAGANGTLLITSDGGNTWAPQQSNTTNHIRSITLKNSNGPGWYCGDGGKEYFYGPSPAASGEEPSPSSALLVFPNPASSTVIITGWGHAGTARITLSDPAGLTVLMLPDAEEGLELDVSGLAAGVYFLRVEAGESSGIEQIVIVK